MYWRDTCSWQTRQYYSSTQANTPPYVVKRGEENFNEQTTKKLYLEPGEFVETTGRVKDGYAEVEEHLIDDTSEYRYGKTWVPVENLKKIEKCNHAHLLRDGLL